MEEENKGERERLDVLLIKKGLAGSREKAKAMVLSGAVFVDGRRATKAGSVFPVSAKVEAAGASLKYVSRGGFKLEKAVRTYGIGLAGMVCMDVGASTGGFTDCMLQNGAARVYAIDAGTGQLDESLRQDGRVVSMEKTNIRHITPQAIPEAVDFVSVDVAFISLVLVLAPIQALMKPGAEIVCLIKPQFEAGRGNVGKKGVVKNPRIHKEVIGKVVSFAAGLGFEMLHLDYSPIKGPEGNIEYLLHMGNSGLGPEDAMRREDVGRIQGTIPQVVAAAGRELSWKE